jgi:hypothetical protein
MKSLSLLMLVRVVLPESEDVARSYGGGAQGLVKG